MQSKQYDGGKSVKHRPLIVLRFDRPLAPSSVSTANYAITSGKTSRVQSIRQVRVDPVQRLVVMTLAADLPGDDDFALHVRAADDPANRLAAFDGAPFQGETVIQFHTRPDSVKDPADTILDPLAGDPTTPGSGNACDVNVRDRDGSLVADSTDPAQNAVVYGVETILRTTCVGAYCHGNPSAPTAPVLGLSFLTSEAIQKSAVGHASIQVEDPSSPGGAGVSHRNFPYGMPIIDPHDSANSYLLFKIMRRAPIGELLAEDPSLDIDDPLPNPAQTVAADLGHYVPGEGMPNANRAPDLGAPSYPALGWAEVQMIRAWIDRGAPPCTTKGPLDVIPCGDGPNTVPCTKPASDAGVDAPTDAPADALTDAPTDAPVDAPKDAPTDAGADG